MFTFVGFIPTGSLLDKGDLEIYVKTNGVHTDLCFPVTTADFDWTKFVPITDFKSVNSATFISIGWGDKGFFLDTPEWSDLKLSTALNAAFFKSGTAMHVQYLKDAPLVSDRVAKVFISHQQYETLIDYVCNSFTQTNGDLELIPNRGYWSNDNFYEAHGNYHLFNTCNVWTNRALKLVGIKTGRFSLSAEGIMRHFK